MWCIFAIALSLLVSSSIASPCKAACKNDVCHSEANSADCLAYLQTTVISYASTATSTVTTTNTANTVTVTNYETLNVYRTSYQVETSVAVTTVDNTAIVSTPVTVRVTKTQIDVVTQTFVPRGFEKRSDVSVRLTRDKNLVPRTVFATAASGVASSSTTSISNPAAAPAASTASAPSNCIGPACTSTGLPPSASQCSGPLQYSSACSCIGITAKTATATSSAATETTTLTVTTAATVTASKTQFLTGVVTITTFSVVQSTAEVTDTTIFLPVPTTVTTTVDVITTAVATVQKSTCSTFTARATSGAYSGQFLRSGGEGNYITFSISPTKFVLNKNGTVNAVGASAVWDMDDETYQAVYQDTNPAAQNSFPLTCSFAAPAGASDGTLGALSCLATNGDKVFSDCPIEVPLGLIIGKDAHAYPDCQQIGIVALPAC